MKRYLAVVDMQNDFVAGSLGTAEAQAILPAVCEKIRRRAEQGYELVFTLDTHGEDYLSTQEGQKLPVPHCIRGTQGWELCREVETAAQGRGMRFCKDTFGSVELAEYLVRQGAGLVELIGLCTDICVISNALLIKAFLPQAVLQVDGTCCAGVTPASHQNALDAMRSCQIEILGE